MVYAPDEPGTLVDVPIGCNRLDSVQGLHIVLSGGNGMQADVHLRKCDYVTGDVMYDHGYGVGWAKMSSEVEHVRILS